MKDQDHLQLDPHDLISRAQAGDKDAFGKIYTLYFTPVYAYILARVKNKADAEDICQAVFIKVYGSLSSYRNTGVSPLAFFFTVARNSLIDFWRKKKDLLFDEEDGVMEVPDDVESAEDLFDSSVRSAAVYKALATLKPISREVLMMKFIHGLSNEEIAHTLDKSEEAIRQIQSRALRELRAVINPTVL